MNELPHPVDDWAIWLVALAAAVSALYVLWQKVVCPMWRLTRQIVRLTNVMEEVAPHIDHLPSSLTLLHEIRSLTDELLPNDGEHLADKVQHLLEQSQLNASTLHRLEARVDHNSETLRELLARHA